jgi:GTP cyclohydrolase I
MNAPLPDIALHAAPEVQAPLSWVGMEGIVLPLRLPGALGGQTVAAKASFSVDLPDASVKGIHMSRLYVRLMEFAERSVLEESALLALLDDAIDSHADCSSTSASICLSFAWLKRQAALMTPALHGYRSYPVRIQASRQRHRSDLCMQFEVSYASTCPGSAALARQALSQHFRASMADEKLAVSEMQAWLEAHGSFATAHAQRSSASIALALDPDFKIDQLPDLVEAAEQALGTPLQTAVKRADEQAFARLNGANLMYSEDAARRLQAALRPLVRHAAIKVRHFESLHPHDAVALATLGDGLQSNVALGAL